MQSEPIFGYITAALLGALMAFAFITPHNCAFGRFVRSQLIGSLPILGLFWCFAMVHPERTKAWSVGAGSFAFTMYAVGLFLRYMNNRINSQQQHGLRARRAAKILPEL